MTDQTIEKPAYISAKKITVGGVLLALTIVLPQMLHFTGNAMAGAMFLPMHIPAILGGFILGPVFGLILGFVAPVISFFITTMPPAARLPFMVAELAAYGFMSGFMYHTLRFNEKKLGIYISLFSTMMVGRAIYALSLLIAGNLLGLHVGGPAAAITATVTGIFGILIQLVIVPPIIYALKKGGRLNEFFERRKKDPS